MALIKLSFDPEKVIADLRKWTTDPETRKLIVKKVDEWTETGLFDKIDQHFIDDFVKNLFTKVTNPAPNRRGGHGSQENA